MKNATRVIIICTLSHDFGGLILKRFPRGSFTQRSFKFQVFIPVNDAHRENSVIPYNSLNSVQEWLIGCFWLFSYVYTINYVLNIPLSRIKEYRCLKNVTHQIERNGCSFQQVLRQSLGWFLSSHWKTLFLRGFSFASNYFIFWRFCSGLRTSYKELIWNTNDPNAYIRIL